MPELDLSTVTDLRVANTEALEVRIANQTVWQKPAPSTYSSVWYPNNYPYTLNVAPDALAIRATGFYIYDQLYFDSKIVGARMWIPEGVTAPEVHLYLWLSGEELTGSKPDFDNPTEIITVPINGAGWVSGMFTVPRKIIVNSMIYIGYRFDDATAIWTDEAPTNYVSAESGLPLGMAEDSFDATSVRTWARLDRDGDYTFSSPGRAFGLDVIVEFPKRIPSTFWSELPTETLSDASGGGVSLATVFKPTVPGVVTHIRFPIPNQYVGTTVTAGLYLREDWPGHGIEGDAIETIVPSEYRTTVSIGSIDTERWKYAALPTPRHVEAGEYMLAIAKFHAEGVNTAYFHPTSDFYFSTDVTNSDGTLIAPASGTVPFDQLDSSAVNGRFSSPYESGWPYYIYADRGYHIDVAFLPDDAEGE